MIGLAILFARVAAAMTALAPCHVDDDECAALHTRAIQAIVVVAFTDAHPDDAAAILLGVGKHETRFRTELQNHGPAVSFWQLEVPQSERAAYLNDTIAAARTALTRARADSTMNAYACGRKRCDTRFGRRVAAELRADIGRARIVWERPWIQLTVSAVDSQTSRKGSWNYAKRTNVSRANKKRDVLSLSTRKRTSRH